MNMNNLLLMSVVAYLVVMLPIALKIFFIAMCLLVIIKFEMKGNN